MQDVKLAARVLAGLPPEVSRSLVLCFGKVDAALEASKQLSNQVFALNDVPEDALTAPILIIGASQDQVRSFFRLPIAMQWCPKYFTYGRELKPWCLLTFPTYDVCRAGCPSRQE